MNWRTAPISRTCEVMQEFGLCKNRTVFAYKTRNRGWMALCEKHAQKHKDYVELIDELLKQGEILQNL
jgi:hypothetical protein